MKSIGFLGFGMMGEAIAVGLAKKHPGIQFFVTDVSTARREHAAQKFGATVSADPAQTVRSADITVIAVKPQDAETLLDSIYTVSKGKRFVSIIAGKPISFFVNRLDKAFVARFMPNLAAGVHKSVTGVSFLPDEQTNDEFRTQALDIASSFGTVLEVPEKLMAAVTGLSGSGIAYVFSFINALALGGTKAGLPYPKALDAALGVLEGAVEAIRGSGTHPIEYLSRVTSPAGTTIEGVAILEQAGFAGTVMSAVDAAARRARELEG